MGLLGALNGPVSPKFLLLYLFSSFMHNLSAQNGANTQFF